MFFARPRTDHRIDGDEKTDDFRIDGGQFSIAAYKNLSIADYIYIR